MDPQQLASFEGMCNALYSSPNDAERSNAQQQRLVLQSGVEYIPQCQSILDHSALAYAQLVASTSLMKLIPTHWNSFSVAQRIDIRKKLHSFQFVCD